MMEETGEPLALSKIFLGLTWMECAYLLLGAGSELRDVQVLHANDPWFPVQKNGSADIDRSKELFEKLYSCVNPNCDPNGIIARMEHAYDTRDKNGTANLPYRFLGGRSYYGGFRHLIEDHVAMTGPLYFGKRVRVYASSKVFGPGFLGDDVVVGTSAIVKRSFIRPGTRIRDGAQLSYAMVGKDVIIGQGVICEYEPEDGVGEHLGPRIGDGCRVGTGAVLASGVTLLPGCIVPRRTVVTKGVYGPDYEFKA